MKPYNPRQWDTPVMRRALADPRYLNPSLDYPADPAGEFEIDEMEHVDRSQAAELRELDLTAEEESCILDRALHTEEGAGEDD